MFRRAPFLLAGLLGVLIATSGARAAPIVYVFSGEMTGFIPPVTQPGVPLPPVPADMRFFTGSFDYDPAGGPDDAITRIMLSFVGGPTIVPVPATRTLTQAVVDIAGGFDVVLSARSLADSSSTDYSLFLQLVRPPRPGDRDAMLPPTLDGFAGPQGFAGPPIQLDLGGQFLYTGTLSRFATAAVVVIDAPAATLALLAIGLAGLAAFAGGGRRRRPNAGAVPTPARPARAAAAR